MSEAITGVVKFVLGFISNKLRTYGAKKLEDGGLADQKFYSLIVRELDDIKSKLDAISRKDLCTSISSLKEGFITLMMSYGESFESGNPSISKIPSTGAGSVEAKPSLSSVTVEDAIALASTIGKIKINSNERLESAKKSFEEAVKKASEAFHNAALSIEERVLACKVRIASRILQHLDDLELAVSKCLLYLRELNDMRAIQEIFSVDVKGGIKSIFKKDSRAEIVESVTMINCNLADLISKFTEQRMAVFDWPMIKCGTQFVHPIHCNRKCLKEMKITPPWDIAVAECEISVTLYFANKSTINKDGDLICFTYDREGPQKLDHKTGKLQPYCLAPSEDTTEHPYSRDVVDLAVDEDDIVYVLTGNEIDGFTLSAYSADGENKHSCTLPFLRGKCGIKMNVNNDKNIVIAVEKIGGSIMIYLSNRNGDVINSFNTRLNYYNYDIQFVSGSCSKEIVLITRKRQDFKYSNVLHIFTEEGQIQKTVKFHPSKGDYYGRLFYNQVTKEIIGFTSNWADGWALIEYLSGQTAELQHSYLLSNLPVSMLWCKFFCHANGTLALFDEDRSISLRKRPHDQPEL